MSLDIRDILYGKEDNNKEGQKFNSNNKETQEDMFGRDIARQKKDIEKEKKALEIDIEKEREALRKENQFSNNSYFNNETDAVRISDTNDIDPHNDKESKNMLEDDMLLDDFIKSDEQIFQKENTFKKDTFPLEGKDFIDDTNYSYNKNYEQEKNADKKVGNEKISKNIENIENVDKGSFAKYLVALFLDFCLFGILYFFVSLFENTVIVEFSGITNRVFVINSLTVFVVQNVFLFSYFYFFAKDNKGSTLIMSLLKIGVVNRSGKVNVSSLLCSNVVFWFYFIIIDVMLLENLLNLQIVLIYFIFLVIQILILFRLNGIDIFGINIVNKKENNEK